MTCKEIKRSCSFATRRNPCGVSALFILADIIGLVCLAASIACFIWFLIKEKENRKNLIITGIRNIFLIPSAVLIFEVHSVGRISLAEEGVDDWKIYDTWHTEYFWYAVGLAVAVFTVFALIDVISRRASKKN